MILTIHELDARKPYLYELSGIFQLWKGNGLIVSVTDLVSFGGHYEVTFNALRHRALWGFNDWSHGTNLDCWLENPKQAIIMGVSTTRHWQTSCRVVEKLNVCTVPHEVRLEDTWKYRCSSVRHVKLMHHIIMKYFFYFLINCVWSTSIFVDKGLINQY